MSLKGPDSQFSLTIKTSPRQNDHHPGLRIVTRHSLRVQELVIIAPQEAGGDHLFFSNQLMSVLNACVFIFLDLGFSHRDNGLGFCMELKLDQPKIPESSGSRIIYHI